MFHILFKPTQRLLPCHPHTLPRFLANLIDLSLGPCVARGCLLSKGQLEALFDMCTGPYDFILITNEPDGRARVRLNGVTPVAGIN